jgi:integrase
MATLTQKELESLSPDDAGRRLIDGGGLTGKVRERKGKIIVQFEYRYRSGEKTRQIVCGTWPDNSLKAVRAKRDEHRTSITQGDDPLDRKLAERLKKKADTAEAVAIEQSRINEIQTLQSRITVRELFERWASIELTRRKDQGKEVRRMFEKDVLPAIGAMAVEDVRKGHITSVTDALLARGVNRMAKQIFSLIRQMLRFAVDRDIIESDPSAAIRKAKIGGKDVERDRVLSEDEIKMLSAQLTSAKMLRSTEAAIWIALSTCCRIGELLQAQWRHISLEKSEWLIPEINSKNKKAHIIYLSEFAKAQFELLQSINAASEWCFPNRQNNNHVCVKTVTKQIGDRQRGKAQPMSRRSPYTNALSLPQGKWSPHDLRRTGATLMTALRVLPEVADRCLNHTEEDRMKRTYLRHDYKVEKQDAWRLLGERLELLTGSTDNVIPLSGRSAA